MKILKTHEVTLNNGWLIEYLEVTDCSNVIDFRLSRSGYQSFDSPDSNWELALEGSIKWDGCCDFGGGLHFCGQEDTAIFYLIYEQAKPLFPNWEG